MLVNGRPAVRVTDKGIHSACCGPNSWVATQGSATVIFNNLQAHRKTDKTTHCGGMGNTIQGSADVIVGG